MNLTLAYRPSHDVTVITKIEPIIRGGLHKINVQRHEPEKKIRVANFIVDNELDAWRFLSIICIHHRTSYDEIPNNLYELFNKNKLEEMYA